MPTISIRVSEDLKSRLDNLAQESESTLSGVILEAINIMTGGSRTNLPEDTAPYTLSSTNRLILRNQELLLSMCEQLDERERNGHAKNAKILESGYTSDYSTIYAPLHPEVPYSMCEELYNILDMFRVLRFSYEKLNDEEKGQVKEGSISFRGFDYSDSTESPLSGYVEFMFENEKYEELEEPMKRFSDDGNSHTQLLPMYRRMYQCFNQVWRKHLLTAHELSLDEIQKVMSAIPYNSGY